MEGMEELMTTTILIGKAISAVTFPGMYRIYDFHSPLAPRLKNAQIKFTPFFAPDSDDEVDDEDTVPPPDPSDYVHMFHVRVGEDVIYIDDPCAANDSGWTPLHACCMSLSTVTAGLLLIEEMQRSGGSFETKTITGPGTFNRGWTALQMACAYGVEPLVEKLVEAGADVNACNSFGYSSLLEACHRGYIVVAMTLLASGKVDLNFIPDEELAQESPFFSAPCQSALAEASRCGFFKVVSVLLEADAPKDLANKLGWTALHEACFYNRMETVKTLLLGGASATVRTKQGALPHHLACIPEIRNMLESMGGPDAVPAAGDKIDMLMILTELTMPSGMDISSMQITATVEDDLSGPMQFDSWPKLKSAPVNVLELGDVYNTDEKGVSPAKEGKITNKGGLSVEEPESGGMLHSGPLLGNLPAFSGNKGSPPKRFQTGMDHAMQQGGGPGSLFGSPVPAGLKKPSLKADGKDSAGKRKKKKADGVPADMPEEFLCQLTRRPMSDPVNTPWGNTYDRTAIVNWLSTQGKICPISGAPLSDTDLLPNKALSSEIKKWILMRSTGAADAAPAEFSLSPAQKPQADQKQSASAAQLNADDDLYDF